MTKEGSKLVYALLDLYLNEYANKYGRKPIINKYKEKWAMNDVIESVGYDRARELVFYYFKTTNPGHSLTWFFYNFDRLDEMLVKLEADKIQRAKMRALTRERVEAREKNEH